MFEQISSNNVLKSQVISGKTVPKISLKDGMVSGPVSLFRFFFLASIIFIQFPHSLPAEAVTQYNQTEIIKQYELESCNDKTLMIEFLCNPKWEYHISEGALMVVISSQPMVTATFAKIDSSVTILAKLNREDLIKRNLYRTGFKTEQGVVNGSDTVVVRAFSRSEPERRVLDYFFIHNGVLFGALFAVSPIDDWDNYKFLIKTISESIKLIKTPMNDAV